MKTINFIQGTHKKGYLVGEEINLVGDFSSFTDEMYVDVAKQVNAAFVAGKLNIG